MDVRENLRNAIRDKGYMQSVIAKKANMSPCKLSLIISLNRKMDANEMLAICKAMYMTPTELAEYKPEPTGTDAG